MPKRSRQACEATPGPRVAVPALAVLWVAALVGACAAPAGPSDEAIARYVADRAKVADAGGSAASAGDRPAPDVVRRVRVTAVGGTGLPDTDDGPGETDAYLELEYDGERFKTSVAESTLEPTWGDTFVLNVRGRQPLIVTLMDQDGALSSDERLGTHTEPLPPLAPGQKQTLTIAFREGAQGTVTLELEGLD